MARGTSVNYTATGINFTYATATSDAFVSTDLQLLAQAVESHDHTSTKGVAIGRVQTGTAPAAPGNGVPNVRANGDQWQWWAATATAVKTATDLDSSQTLTNKTLTTPTISTPVLTLETASPIAAGRLAYSGGLLRFGDGAGRTVVEIDATQTLTNKTLSGPTLSGTVSGTPTWASSQAMSITGSSASCTGNAATSSSTTGSSASCTGNAATATTANGVASGLTYTNPTLSGTVSGTPTWASTQAMNVSGSSASCTGNAATSSSTSGSSASCTGNAATATTANGVASGLTYTNPTLSGTVSGTPTWASNQAFPGATFTAGPQPAANNNTACGASGVQWTSVWTHKVESSVNNDNLILSATQSAVHNDVVQIAGGGAMAPMSNGGASCGTSALPWSAVYANNGTIQASHSSTKEGFTVLEPAEALQAVIDTDFYEYDYKAPEMAHVQASMDSLAMVDPDRHAEMMAALGEGGIEAVVRGWVEEHAPARKNHFGYKAEVAHRYLSPDGRTVRPQSTAVVGLAAIKALAAKVAALEARAA